MTFNLSKLAQNLSKAGQTMLGTALFVESTKMARGQYGGSVFGCYGGYSAWCGAPPLNIFHPYYSQGLTSPYLLQQGMAQADAGFMDMFNQNIARVKGTTPEAVTETTNTDLGETLADAVDNGKEFKFVTDKWSELDAKRDELSTEDKQKVTAAYTESLKQAGKSFVAAIDKKFGDGDEKLSVEEFSAYVLSSKLGENATEEEKNALIEKAKTAFARLDIDENEELSAKDAVTALYFMDNDSEGQIDGKVSGETFNAFKQELTAENDEISEPLRNCYKNLFEEAE